LAHTTIDVRWQRERIEEREVEEREVEVREVEEGEEVRERR
jgi:hypothetical protein